MTSSTNPKTEENVNNRRNRPSVEFNDDILMLQYGNLDCSVCPVCNKICGNDPNKCFEELKKRINDEEKESTYRASDSNHKICFQTSKKKKRGCKECCTLCCIKPSDDSSTPYSQDTRSSKLCPICKSICNNNPKTCLANLEKKIKQDVSDAKKCSKFCPNRANRVCPVCEKQCDHDPVDCFKKLKKKWENEQRKSKTYDIPLNNNIDYSSSTQYGNISSPKLCPVCKTTCNNNPKSCLANLERNIKQDVIDAKKCSKSCASRASRVCRVCEKQCGNDPMDCFKKLKKKWENDKRESKTSWKPSNNKINYSSSTQYGNISSPKLCPVCKTTCNHNPKNCLANLEKKIKQAEIDAKKCSKSCANRASHVCPVCEKQCDNDPKDCFKKLKKKWENDKRESKTSWKPSNNKMNYSSSTQCGNTSSPKLCPVCKSICNNNPKKCLAVLEKKIKQDEMNAKKNRKLSGNQASRVCPICEKQCDNDPKDCFKKFKKKWENEERKSKTSYTRSDNTLNYRDSKGKYTLGPDTKKEVAEDKKQQCTDPLAEKQINSKMENVDSAGNSISARDSKNSLMEDFERKSSNSSLTRSAKPFDTNINERIKSTEDCLKRYWELEKEIKNLKEKKTSGPRSITDNDTEISATMLKQEPENNDSRLYNICPVCKVICKKNPKLCLAALEKKLEQEKLEGKKSSESYSDVENRAFPVGKPKYCNEIKDPFTQLKKKERKTGRKSRNNTLDYPGSKRGSTCGFDTVKGRKTCSSEEKLTEEVERKATNSDCSRTSARTITERGSCSNECLKKVLELEETIRNLKKNTSISEVDPTEKQSIDPLVRQEVEQNIPKSDSDQLGLRRMEECVQVCLDQIDQLRKQILSVRQQTKTVPSSEPKVTIEDYQSVESGFEKMKHLQNKIDICGKNANATIRKIEQIKYQKNPCLSRELCEIYSPVQITEQVEYEKIKLITPDAKISRESIHGNKTNEPINPDTPSAKQSGSRNTLLPKTCSELTRCTEDCLKKIKSLEEEIKILHQIEATKHRPTDSSTNIAKHTANGTPSLRSINKKEQGIFLENQNANKNKVANKKCEDTDDMFLGIPISLQTHNVTSPEKNTLSNFHYKYPCPVPTTKTSICRVGSKSSKSKSISIASDRAVTTKNKNLNNCKRSADNRSMASQDGKEWNNGPTLSDNSQKSPTDKVNNYNDYNSKWAQSSNKQKSYPESDLKYKYQYEKKCNIKKMKKNEIGNPYDIRGSSISSDTNENKQFCCKNTEGQKMGPLERRDKSTKRRLSVQQKEQSMRRQETSTKDPKISRLYKQCRGPPIKKIRKRSYNEDDDTCEQAEIIDQVSIPKRMSKNQEELNMEESTPIDSKRKYDNLVNFLCKTQNEIYNPFIAKPKSISPKISSENQTPTSNEPDNINKNQKTVHKNYVQTFNKSHTKDENKIVSPKQSRDTSGSIIGEDDQITQIQSPESATKRFTDNRGQTINGADTRGERNIVCSEQNHEFSQNTISKDTPINDTKLSSQKQNQDSSRSVNGIDDQINKHNMKQNPESVTRIFRDSWGQTINAADTGEENKEFSQTRISEDTPINDTKVSARKQSQDSSRSINGEDDQINKRKLEQSPESATRTFRDSSEQTINAVDTGGEFNIVCPKENKEFSQTRISEDTSISDTKLSSQKQSQDSSRSKNREDDQISERNMEQNPESVTRTFRDSWGQTINTADTGEKNKEFSQTIISKDTPINDAKVSARKQGQDSSRSKNGEDDQINKHKSEQSPDSATRKFRGNQSQPFNEETEKVQHEIVSPKLNPDSPNKIINESRYYNQDEHRTTNENNEVKINKPETNYQNQLNVSDPLIEIAITEGIIEQESGNCLQSTQNLSGQNTPERHDPRISSNTGEQKIERAKSPCIPALRTSDSEHRQALSLLRDLYVATKPLHDAMRCGVPPEETLDIIRKLTYKEPITQNVKPVKKENSSLFNIDKKVEDDCPADQYISRNSIEIDKRGRSVSERLNPNVCSSARSEKKRTSTIRNKSDKVKPRKSIPSIYVMTHSKTDIRASLECSSDNDQFANTQVSPETRQHTGMQTTYLQSYDNPLERPKPTECEEKCNYLKEQPYAHNPRKNGLERSNADNEQDQGCQRKTYSSTKVLFSSELMFTNSFCCGGSPRHAETSNRPNSTPPVPTCPCDRNQKVSWCKKHGIRYKNRATSQGEPQNTNSDNRQQ